MKALQTPRVLVVDDDPVMCKTLRRLLNERGFEATSFHEGRRALMQLHRGVPYPNVLVMDLHIPDLSGLKIMRTLTGEGIRIPTLAISGLFESLSADQLARLGCHDFLEKPFKAEQFLERIGRLLLEDPRR